MLFAATLAAVCWVLLGVVPRAHTPLLLAALGVNVFLVVASTVMGGLHGGGRPALRHLRTHHLGAAIAGRARCRSAMG